jgi:hypothetical protein
LGWNPYSECRVFSPVGHFLAWQDVKCTREGQPLNFVKSATAGAAGALSFIKLQQEITESPRGCGNRLFHWLPIDQSLISE